MNSAQKLLSQRRYTEPLSAAWRTHLSLNCSPLRVTALLCKRCVRARAKINQVSKQANQLDNVPASSELATGEITQLCHLRRAFVFFRLGDTFCSLSCASRAPRQVLLTSAVGHSHRKQSPCTPAAAILLPIKRPIPVTIEGEPRNPQYLHTLAVICVVWCEQELNFHSYSAHCDGGQEESELKARSYHLRRIGCTWAEPCMDTPNPHKHSSKEANASSQLH